MQAGLLGSLERVSIFYGLNPEKLAMIARSRSGAVNVLASINPGMALKSSDMRRAARKIRQDRELLQFLHNPIATRILPHPYGAHG